MVDNVFAWDEDTHALLVEYASEESVLGSTKDNYLVKNLDFTDGLDDSFKKTNQNFYLFKTWQVQDKATFYGKIKKHGIV